MKKIIILILIVLAPAATFSQEGKQIVTVLDFDVSQVSEQDASILVDFFASHLVEKGQYRVIDRSQRQNILNELHFSYEGCADEKCQLEIGRLLAARYIFIGSLGKLGSRYILNMSLVDVETGESVKSFSDKYLDMDCLVDGTGIIVDFFTLGERVHEEEGNGGAVAIAPMPVLSGTAAAPPANTSPVRTSSRTASKRNWLLDLGVMIGGPLEESRVEGVCWGVYCGALFPVKAGFYIGPEMNVLVSSEDPAETGTFLMGLRLCFGNPKEFAVSLGLDAANAPDFTGGAILGGTAAILIGGFELKLFYGQDLKDSLPILTVGCGIHF